MSKKSVSEIYSELAVSELVKKAQDANISNYITNWYLACKPNLNTMSLQEFAAYTSNYNPNKSGIGEKSQIQWLKDNKFSTIEKLPNHGKGAVSLYRSPTGILTIEMGKKSNLAGVKSFDAMAKENNEIQLFVLKTVDIGFQSDNVGGGHQTNVKDEVVNLISNARQQQIVLNGKSVKIYVVVDGRSAHEIIQAGQKASGGASHIVINESEKL